jgi:hypothetical protein
MEMKTIRYVIILILLVACEERFNETLNLVPTELVAVEAVLTNENVAHAIKLSFPYQQLNGSPIPATGAQVRIRDGSSTVYEFTENPQQPGEYVSTPFRAVFGELYTLVIELNGKEYFAQDSSIPVEPMNPLQYQAVNNQFELVLNQTGTSPNYINHTITWQENNSPCATCIGQVVFYDLKSIDINEINKPGKKQFLFPDGATVIRKKHSVSPAYRNFLRSMLSETEWRGGVFDVDRANTATNLSAGATGFFAVTTVVSDTTIIQ